MIRVDDHRSATNLGRVPISKKSTINFGSALKIKPRDPSEIVYPLSFANFARCGGDSLDILVLMDAPAHVGCLIEVRLIGVIAAEQTEDGKKEENDRLLGVAIHSYDHEDLTTIGDVSNTLLSQLEEFFVSYNKQRGKKFKITGTGGPRKAVKLLKSGSEKRKAARQH